jgi:hypothetical protein
MKQRLRDASGRIGQFLRWWSAELSFCAQDAIAFVAPQWRRPLTVFVTGDRLVITDRDLAIGKPIVDIARECFRSSLPENLPSPLPAALEQGRRARVVIGAQHAFIRRLRLPLAALPHLKTAIALQLPKLLPVGAQHLMTDFEVVSADTGARIVEIHLAALKRADVEPILRSVQAWGLRIASLHLADSMDAPARFRFASLSANANPSAIRRVDRWLFGTAAGLGFGCMALAATESYRAEHALDQAQQQTNRAASTALGDRQFLLARLGPLQALAQIEKTPSIAAVLTDLTTLVPADSWVTTFELKHQSLRLVGVSPDSAALVMRLASSHLLNDVQLRSSMSAGVGTGKDRFEIAAEVKPDFNGASP